MFGKFGSAFSKLNESLHTFKEELVEKDSRCI